jgi:DNA-directed RNA polymerase subunit omega
MPASALHWCLQRVEGFDQKISASLIAGDFLNCSVRSPNRAARILHSLRLEHVENRFELVMLSTKRARQLATGGKEPLVQWENDKPTVVALREIAEGVMSYEYIAEQEIVQDEPLFAAFEDESNEAV